MDVALWVVLALVLIFASAAVASVVATIDAARCPREVWMVAGFHKSTWLPQVIGVICPPIAPIYTGTYFFRVRPRLQAAAAALGPGPSSANDYQRTGSSITGPARGVAPTSAQVIKVRGFWAFRLAPLLPAGAFGVTALVWSRTGVPTFLWGEWTVIAVLGLAGASWFGINLTPTEAVVNSLRRSHIPWTRVECIRQESFLGGRRVVLWTDQNERIPLRAPILDFTSIGRRRFESDFQVIGNWWIEHGGVEAGR